MHLRTKTYNYLYGAFLLASVGGAALASLLLSNHVYLLNTLSVLCYALTAWIALSIPSHCGRDFKDAEDKIPILIPKIDSPSTPYSPLQQPQLTSDASTRVVLFIEIHPL